MFASLHSLDLPRLSRLSHEQSLRLALRVSAALLWVPHAAVSLATAADSTGDFPFNFPFNFGFPFDFGFGLAVALRVAFSLAAVALTYFLAVYRERGDYVLILAWVVGALSEDAWPTAPSAPGPGALFDGSAPALRLRWVAVAMAHGAIGGLLCKLKDIEEGRYYASHAVGERLYVVVPFCTGQWLRFVLKHGWRGIVVENMTIVLSLALAGYSMILYKMLTQHTSLARGDIIGFVSKIFTTSFGVVLSAIILGNIFVTSLAIPFFQSLFSLNALVSSLGIALELLVYEVA